MPRLDLIQYRRGTESEWNSRQPVLLSGEVGYDTTNNQIRVGDGATAWSGLVPIGGSTEELEEAVAQAQAAAIQAQESVASIEPGAPGGIATLDGDGKVPEEQVPDRLSDSSLKGKFTSKNAIYVTDFLPDSLSDPAANRSGYAAAVSAAEAGSKRLCYDGARFTMAGDPVLSVASDMVHYATDRSLTKIIQSTKGKPALVISGESTVAESLHIDGDNPTLDGIIGNGFSFRTVGIWIDPTAHNSTIRNARVGGFFYGIRAHLYPWAELADANADAPTVATASTYPSEASRPSLRNLTVDGIQVDNCWAGFHCVSVNGITLRGVTGRYLQAPGSTADPHLVYINSIYSADEKTIFRPVRNLVWDDCTAIGGTNRHAYRARGVEGMVVSNLRAVDCPGLFQFISVKGLQVTGGCTSDRDLLPRSDGSGSMSLLYAQGNLYGGQVVAAESITPAPGISIDGCENLVWTRPRVAFNASSDISSATTVTQIELLGANAGCKIIDPEMFTSGPGLIASALRFSASGVTSGDNQALVERPRIIGGRVKYGIWGANPGVYVIYNQDEIAATAQKVRMHTSTTSLRMKGINIYAPERYDLDPSVIAWNMGEALQADDASTGRRWGGGIYGFPLINTWAGDAKGRLWITGAGDYALTCVNVNVLDGATDAEVVARVKKGTATRAGLALKCVDDANTLAFNVRSDTQVELIKRVANSTTTLMTATVAYPASLFAELRAVCIGSRIICFHNGVQVIDYTLAEGAEATMFAGAVRYGIYGNSGTLTSAIWQTPVVRKIT